MSPLTFFRTFSTQSKTTWLRGFSVDDYDLRVVGGGRESPPAPVFLIRLSLVVDPFHNRLDNENTAFYGRPSGRSGKAETALCGLAEVLVTISLETGNVSSACFCC